MVGESYSNVPAVQHSSDFSIDEDKIKLMYPAKVHCMLNYVNMGIPAGKKFTELYNIDTRM